MRIAKLVAGAALAGVLVAPAHERALIAGPRSRSGAGLREHAAMGEAAVDTEEAAPRGGRLDLQHGWVPLAGLIVAVCLPILLSVVDAARAGWVPTADAATIVHRSFDMWTSNRPLVGQYSLAGDPNSPQVFSPGPFLYLVLAPAARFGPAWALPLTMGLLASACFGLALHAARRIGGWWFAVVVAVGLLGTIRASGASTFVEVWNPWAGLAPFAALVFVCWLLALGNRWWLVPAVVLASFVVQSHLTYLPPSLVLLAVGIAGAWMPDRWRERLGSPGSEGASRWRPAIAAVAAGLVCWSLPLYQQVTNDPGNLTLVREAASAEDATFGPSIAVNVWWRASGAYPGFVRAATSQIAELNELRPDAGPAAWIGTGLLALAVAALGWAGLRRRRGEVVIGAVIALGLMVASLATTSRLPLDRLIVAPYSLRWMITAGLIPWLVAALAVIRFDLLRRWIPERGLPKGVAAVAVALVAVAGLTVSRTDDAAWMSDPAREAGDALVEATAPGDRVSLAHSGRYEIVMTPALALRMREAGRHPVLVRNFRVGTGEQYGRDGVRCDTVVVLLPSTDPAPDGAERIAVVPYDEPGHPQEMAMYLLDDDSPDGTC